MSAEVVMQSKAGVGERLSSVRVVVAGETQRFPTPVSKVIDVTCDTDNTRSHIIETDVSGWETRGFWDWLRHKKSPVYGDTRAVILRDGENYSLVGHTGIMSYVEEEIRVTHYQDR